MNKMAFMYGMSILVLYFNCEFLCVTLIYFILHFTKINVSLPFSFYVVLVGICFALRLGYWFVLFFCLFLLSSVCCCFLILNVMVPQHLLFILLLSLFFFFFLLEDKKVYIYIHKLSSHSSWK